MHGNRDAESFASVLTRSAGSQAHHANGESPHVESATRSGCTRNTQDRREATSKDLARVLADRPQHIPIVAQPSYLSYAGPPLSAYLKERVYYALAGGVVRGSYLWYDELRVRGASENEIVNEIERFARDRATDVYVVVSHWDSTRLGTRIADLPQNTIEGDERTTTVYLSSGRIDGSVIGAVIPLICASN
jgi:hypothetical protein